MMHSTITSKLSKQTRHATLQSRLTSKRTSTTICSASSPLPSLITETLESLSSDEELQALYAQVAKEGQAVLTKKEQTQRQRSLDTLGIESFASTCAAAGVSPLKRQPTTTFQLNIGLYCNQACKHCHVESSPLRTEEVMSRSIADRCLELLNQAPSVRTLDLTGGAPELTPQFRHLVESASKIDHVEEIIDRCNLTVLLEPGQEDLAEFLAKHKVKIVASLPCYTPETVNKQRGGGVFGRSITALQQFNSLGYGQPGTGLVLDLVYNPSGIFLAPSQASLTEAYRAELKEGYNIVFNNLYALNNMPIKRWADYLIKEGRLEEYMGLLVGSFNPGAAEGG